MNYDEFFKPLYPRNPTLLDLSRYMDRQHLAESVAMTSGLRYVSSDEYREIACHHCDELLLEKIGWVAFGLYVTPDGHCMHCGGKVPVIGISQAEYNEIQREAAEHERLKAEYGDDWAELSSTQPNLEQRLRELHPEVVES
jgi:hypothetical protein